MNSRAPQFDRFSQPALLAMFWARLEAGRLGADALGPEHLLMGLLTADQGESGRTAAGIWRNKPGWSFKPETQRDEPFFEAETAARLRTTLKRLSNPGVPKPDHGDMPLAERAYWALIAGEEYSGNAVVQLLHILWGLVSDKESPVSKLLNVNGVSVEEVEKAIQYRY